ncbi:disease resistance protein At4g27190-like [Castanea sativa]|uniref:disease resistance protein At4g27190-like n=1 Tax=Castanea sativa TaxID=21020 RepID=UPI003F65268D
MEVVGAAVGALVATTSELLCSCVSSKTKTTFNLHSDVAAVEQEMKSLTDRIKEVKGETEAAEKEGHKIRAQVVTWLKDVETLQPRVNAIQGQMFNNKKPSRCFLNCRKRYRASREVEEILKEVKRLLLVAGSFDSGVVCLTGVPRAVEHIPGPSIQGQDTASKKLDEIMKALDVEGVQRIGIWGLGGVGKTTLVKNLNNELKKASTQPFGIVIWATVSKNLVIKNVQKQIAERLNLAVKMEESMQRMASRLYQRLENEEKFLLILDDVWAKIDLDTLGVPGPEVHKGCKIILTSRLKEVCRTMTTDVEIKMDVLNDGESWQLFCQKAGDVAHLEEIRPLAEAIVKECCRLPLAIITVGAALRKKTKVELWRHALKELQRSVPSIEGIEAEVYKPLKLSYDSLQGNNIKSCFLYCCLFPEDFAIEIKELVQYWRAEGLIGEGQNWEDMDEGISLIENLKDSCLLEDDPLTSGDEKTVKMHDVVRDVAIWISSSSEDGCKSLVRSGIGLSEISVGEFSNSNSLNRVSFMHNNITRLPNCMIQCSKASALLLQGNRALDTIPEKFLQEFEALKVLNLSGTNVWSLPHSLIQLRDLRVLLLRNCNYLKELPSLGTLSKLRELDLSTTCIANLPRGIENLSELRLLNLADTIRLKSFQPRILSKLSCLESLSMWKSGFRFRLKGEEDGQATFEEFKSSFNRLHYLNISLNGIPWGKSEDLSWINGISHLELRFYLAQGMSVVLITIDEKRCSIQNLNLFLSQEWIGWFWGNSSSLQLRECTGLLEMLEGFIESDASFAGLKSLSIIKCPTSSGQGRGCAACCDVLPNLGKLHLYDVENLNSISELGLRFHSLKSLEVFDCFQMRYVLSGGDFIQTLPNLEVLKVNKCTNLEELFNIESGQNMAPYPVVPKLRILELKHLGELVTLCRHEETWQCLEEVEVFNCLKMRYVLSCGDFIQTLPNLEVIKVSNCWNLEELFNIESGQNMAPDPVVPKLRILELKRLYKLVTLCRHEETWPCLEQVEVLGCDRLRRLPLTNQNAGTIKEIIGYSRWWDALEWDDDQIKSSLLPFFHPHDY